MHVNADKVMGLTTKKSPKVVDTQSDSWSKDEKLSVAHLDLNYVHKKRRERLTKISTQFDRIYEEKLGEINATFHNINLIQRLDQFHNNCNAQSQNQKLCGERIQSNGLREQYWDCNSQAAQIPLRFMNAPATFL